KAHRLLLELLRGRRSPQRAVRVIVAHHVLDEQTIVGRDELGKASAFGSSDPRNRLAFGFGQEQAFRIRTDALNLAEDNTIKPAGKLSRELRAWELRSGIGDAGLPFTFLHQGFPTEEDQVSLDRHQGFRRLPSLLRDVGVDAARVVSRSSNTNLVPSEDLESLRHPDVSESGETVVHENVELVALVGRSAARTRLVEFGEHEHGLFPDRKSVVQGKSGAFGGVGGAPETWTQRR